MNPTTAKFKQGKVSFQLELNSFAHLTDDEFFIVTNGGRRLLLDESIDWPHFKCTRAPLFPVNGL